VEAQQHVVEEDQHQDQKEIGVKHVVEEEEEEEDQTEHEHDESAGSQEDVFESEPPVDTLVVAILGLSTAGKTCFLRALEGAPNLDTVPTVGVDHRVFTYNDKTKVKIYDLGGARDFRSVWKFYFAELWGFVWVADATNAEAFEESRVELHAVLDHPMMAGKPFTIVANKQDLDGAADADQVRNALDVGPDAPVFGMTCQKYDEANNAKLTSTLIISIIKESAKLAQKRIIDLAEQDRLDEEARAAKMAKLMAKQTQNEGD
jgi:small GTP-binding protein